VEARKSKLQKLPRKLPRKRGPRAAERRRRCCAIMFSLHRLAEPKTVSA
jgi:hypothetical protein